MKKYLQILSLVITLLCANSFNSFAHGNKNPNDHAPIGVMRDHVHKKGESMASYRFGYMKMKGLIQGDNKIQTGEVLKNFMMAPREMSMKMHMIGAMYGITDNYTIAAAANAVTKSMKSVNRMGKEVKNEVAEIGDVKIQNLYQFLKNENHQAQFNLGLSLPTGSYNEKNNTTRFPYGMQAGSGSYDLLPGISYKNNFNDYSFGAQINAIFRLNSNDLGYKLGDSFNITSWISKNINNEISLSARLDYLKNDAIEGVDKSLDVGMVPLTNISVYKSQRLDFLLGTNYLFQKSFLKGHRLGLEFGIPLYQRISGPALENDYKFTIGWQKSF